MGNGEGFEGIDMLTVILKWLSALENSVGIMRFEVKCSENLFDDGEQPFV